MRKTSARDRLTADLAPSGALRAAINLGNPVLAWADPFAGPTGVAVDLAHELARRLALPLELVLYQTGGAVIPDLATGSWDVAFLAVEPERAAQATFTAPYAVIDATFLVHDKGPFHAVGDLDREGVRIAAATGAAYALALSRQLRFATLVEAPSSPAAIEIFQDRRLEAVAGIRQALADAARPGLRLLPDSFSRIEQGLAIVKGRRLAADYLTDFIEAVKAEGFVRQSLDRHGQANVPVAPPARPALTA